jgi:hypothetical protein
MKVIKKGRPQKGWAKEFTCTGKGNGNGGCGALLLVEIGDVFETQSQCRDETDYYVTFRCGSCGVLNDIDNPPSEVRTAAQQQKALWRNPNWKPEK